MKLSASDFNLLEQAEASALANMAELRKLRSECMPILGGATDSRKESERRIASSKQLLAELEGLRERAVEIEDSALTRLASIDETIRTNERTLQLVRDTFCKNGRGVV